MKIGFVLVATLVGVAAFTASETLLNHGQEVSAAGGKVVAAVAKPTPAKPTLHQEIEAGVPPLLDAIKDRVRDPASLQFRNVTAVRPNSTPSGFMYCGLVNARNSFGGYGDFVPFFMAGSSLRMGNDQITLSVFDQFCNHATVLEVVDPRLLQP